MKRETLLKIITGLIAALFFYASISKITDFDKSRHEMLSQVFPKQMALILVWLIPLVEICITIFLLFKQSRKRALFASLILLSVFTLYIGIVMTGIFGRIPCSCGGILKNMPYSIHFIFNLFFIAIAVYGIFLENNFSVYNGWLNLKKERNIYKTVDKSKIAG